MLIRACFAPAFVQARADHASAYADKFETWGSDAAATELAHYMVTSRMPKNSSHLQSGSAPLLTLAPPPTPPRVAPPTPGLPHPCSERGQMVRSMGALHSGGSLDVAPVRALAADVAPMRALPSPPPPSMPRSTPHTHSSLSWGDAPSPATAPYGVPPTYAPSYAAPSGTTQHHPSLAPRVPTPPPHLPPGAMPPHPARAHEYAIAAARARTEAAAAVLPAELRGWYEVDQRVAMAAPRRPPGRVR